MSPRPTTTSIRFSPKPAVAVDPAVLRKERVLATYAGLRVLPSSDGSTVDARRETAFLTGKGGMLTVAGGKLTTYRRIALDALDRLSGELGLSSVDRRPGAASRRLRRRQRRRTARHRLEPRARGGRAPGPLLRRPIGPRREARGRRTGAARTDPPRCARSRGAGGLRGATRNGRRAPKTSSEGGRPWPLAASRRRRDRTRGRPPRAS